jgi:hypothetical protein
MEVARDVEVVQGGMRVCRDMGHVDSSSSSSSSCMRIVVSLKDAWGNAAAAAGSRAIALHMLQRACEATSCASTPPSSQPTPCLNP